MKKQKKIIPFSQFRKSHKIAKVSDFKALPNTKVVNEDEFERMKKHLADYYEGIKVKHSYMDDTGQIWDCIPADQQPALLKTGKKMATPPDARGKFGKSMRTSSASSVLKDRFGNSMSCPAGTVPLRRITLEELTRFDTLDHFFRKGPSGKGRHPRFNAPAAAESDGTHKWAHAFQDINNQGGRGFLSINQPAISEGQIFSLSQHWYTAGDNDGLQTLEVGWQVYPQKYGDNLSHLFIYWTADNYNNTGCYNNEQGLFVLSPTNSDIKLGMSVGPISVDGGSQYELEVCWVFSDNCWWLYVQNEAIGYYPVSIYNNGPMASYATEIDYGGEVDGYTSWAPMGSGAAAAQGWQHAAYQRSIYYFPIGNGDGIAPDLTPVQDYPNCYTISLGDNAAWGEYFYFGGPGGNNC